MEDVSHCSDGDWDDWRIHNIPQCLVPQWRNLISHLKGVAPLIQDTKCSFRWDPDRVDYSVESGYATIQQQANQDWDHWRDAWKI